MPLSLSRYYPVWIVAENLPALRSALAGCAAVAQLVERVLGKDEAMGSSPISSFRQAALSGLLWGSHGLAADFFQINFVQSSSSLKDTVVRSLCVCFDRMMQTESNVNIVSCFVSHLRWSVV